MGLFRKKKKPQPDYGAKAHEIERNIWELENKQIVYLDKMKAVVLKQAEYKAKAAEQKDKNMQRHFAALYLNAEKEKEQYAYSINQISNEIVSNVKMAQLVERQTLFLELEKMQSLSLEEIAQMSDSISASRSRRETMTQLRGEAIDRALYHSEEEQRPINDAADELLETWARETAEEKSEAPSPEPERPQAEEPLGEGEDETEEFLKSLRLESGDEKAE